MDTKSPKKNNKELINPPNIVSFWVEASLVANISNRVRVIKKSNPERSAVELESGTFPE